LAPFVLVVSNDLVEDSDLTKPDVPDDAVLTDLTIPLEAFANTRTSRGRLAGGTEKKVSIPVSMSWWLSRPIQILLHQQSEGRNEKNQNQNRDQIERV